MNVKVTESDIDLITPNPTESNSNSINFVSMDMKVYDEEDESLDNVELKRKIDLNGIHIAVEEYHSDINLPLTSIKNISNQEESFVESGRNPGTIKSRDNIKKLAEIQTVQKENCLRQNRYKLRNRAFSKKSEHNLVNENTKKSANQSFKNSSKTNSQNSLYSNKSKVINCESVTELKCIFCYKSFNNQFQFDSHKTSCDKSIKCQEEHSCFTNPSEEISGQNTNSDHECQKCLKIIKDNAQSVKHHCSNETTTAIECYVCNKLFEEPMHLNIHLRDHKKSLHKRSKNNQSLKGPDMLKYHQKDSESLENLYHCKDCDEIFHKKVSLQKHMHKHKSSGLKCHTCKKLFVSPQKLAEHVALGTCQKANQILKYECDECKCKFSKLVKLKIHILNIHHGINYQCEKCKKKFTSQEDKDIHLASKDCKTETPSVCQECNKVFSKKEYLKKHLYMHSNVLLKCKYCYCAFMKEKSYKNHLEKMNCSKSARKIKMAEYNYSKCRLCDIQYETEDILIQHFSSVHHDQKPHQCFCCDSCLPTFKDLQNHIHQHNTQKYTCNLCGKPYTSQEGFRKHRLKHKGAEFKCKFCESEFLNESRFKVHEKTCKKNPKFGYQPPHEKPKKKDSRPKQSRQLHWESRIIMKHLRGDPSCNKNNLCNVPNENSLVSSFFDEPETEPTSERGWFDNYYKTEEDDLAFGLKKNDLSVVQDCESDFDVGEFLQTASPDKKKTLFPLSTPSFVEDFENNSTAETDSGSSDESETDSSEEEVEETQLTIDYDPKKCRLCVITFGQEYELLHHFIKNHPGENAHKCPNCDVQSPLFAQLKEHMKVHGIGMDIHNCDNCSKTFKSEKKMKSHNNRCKGMNVNFTREHGKREEYCKKCGKRFQTKFGYKKHRRVCKVKKIRNKLEKAIPAKESQETQEVFDINDCPLSDDNNDVGNTNFCSIISNESTIKPETEQSRTDSELKKTDVKDSYVGEPPLDSFPCRLCEKKFQYERGIVMHFKAVHPGHKPLICHVCNMHLADKLKEHLKTHGIGEEFICELCGKRFNQKFLSKIHEMWHEGIEYKCNNCKQKFLNKEKMDKHISENRCSNRQSLMKLPCDICGKHYKSKFGLSKHYITHTPKEFRPVKNRMNCEYCGKWFENNNGLQRHRRIHTGERPFCCRFCPKAFAQEGNCKVHERIHTGESKPRRKKSTTSATEPLVSVASIPVPSAISAPLQSQMIQVIPSNLETISYPGQINVYIYNNIDPNSIVH